MAENWQFLIALNEQLRPLTRATDIQEVAVRLTAEYLRANRVNYALNNGDEFTIGYSFNDGVAPLPERGRVTFFG